MQHRDETPSTSERLMRLETLWEHSNRLSERQHEENKLRLDAILDQTKITNGRVNKLEEWKHSSNGSVKVLMWLLAPLGGVAGLIANHLFPK